MDVIPFGERLDKLLRERGADGSQTWLADRSGIDRSLISRILNQERIPTAETLQALAPALGLDVATLVDGTDAAGRLSAVADHVRRSDYEEAVGKVIEYETRIRDLEARCRSQEEMVSAEAAARRTAESATEKERAESERKGAKLSELDRRHEAQTKELARYKVALQRALADFSTLKTRVADLQGELGKASKSSKTSALLAGVAAVTGVATLAHFLQDEGPTKPPPRKPERKKR